MTELNEMASFDGRRSSEIENSVEYEEVAALKMVAETCYGRLAVSEMVADADEELEDARLRAAEET